MNNSGNVQALRSDGTVGWTKNIASPGSTFPALLPDFQGGLAVVALDSPSVYKLDGTTGQAYPAYTATSHEDQALGSLAGAALHTDGTIFTVDYACSSIDCPGSTDSQTGAWVVGIDPLTGQSKFKIPAANSTSAYTVTGNDTFCGTPGSGQNNYHAWPSVPIIAGDGYAYSTYFTQDDVSAVQEAAQPYPAATYPLFTQLARDLNNTSAVVSDLDSILASFGCSYNASGIQCASGTPGYRSAPFGQIETDAHNGGDMMVMMQDFDTFVSPAVQPVCNRSDSTTYKLHLLKAGSDGSSTDTVLHQWQSTSSTVYDRDPNNPWSYTQTQSAAEPQQPTTYVITNADTGALVSWDETLASYCASGTDQGCTSNVDEMTNYHLTGSAGGDAIWPAVAPYQAGPAQPMLQLEDGSYVGIAWPGGIYAGPQYMVRFDTSGNVLGVAGGGYLPQIATSNGGVIATAGAVYGPNGLISNGTTATFDASLKLTGQIGTLATYSWLGNAYLDGAVSLLFAMPPNTADSSFEPSTGANPSENSTALQRCAPLDSATNANLEAAYSALTNFLLGKYCPLCNSAIFQQVEEGTSQAEFTSFLQQGHEFCDGTKSQDPAAVIGQTNATVADYFQVSPTTTAATVRGGHKTFPVKYPWLGVTIFSLSSSERKTLRIFFNPSLVSVDLTTNESMLFHEALHGFTALTDGGVVGQIGLCDVIGPTPSTKIIKQYPECGTQTVDITTWILDNIVSPH